MEISNSFRVSVPVEQAWHTLLDVERIAPCLPGAALQEVDGDEYRGVVKVKVGPITSQYQGKTMLTQVDDDAHHLVLEASGRETRGQGNASATIAVDLEPDGDGTRVSIDTDLAITGRVAQLGRGVMADVAQQLLAQFAENLERDVFAAPEDAGDDDESQGDTSPRTGDFRRVDAPLAEPVDLLEVGGASVVRRLLPYAVVALVFILLWRTIRHRLAGRS